MSLFFLILYGAINLAMVLWHFRVKEEIYKFPFWSGLISLGWFYPQAVGGYFNVNKFPPYSYDNGMLFASLCTLGLWGGWILAYRKPLILRSWLTMPFVFGRLYYVGAGLCIVGFYFQWKLWSLPDELLPSNQVWTGAAVKYHFLGSLFRVGFIIIWLLYLNHRKWLSPRFLIFIIPCLLLFLDATVLRGRRSEMMNMVSYLLVSFWFVRGMVLSRGLLLAGLLCGLVFINSIGVYRSIMTNEDVALNQRVEEALNANYLSSSTDAIKESGTEFNNYIFSMAAHGDNLYFDYGGYHWNRFVFNYIPAQLVGQNIKSSLMLPLLDIKEVIKNKYGYYPITGSTLTGYADAFGSFSWFGIIKFILIGLMMGVLYRYALSGYFIPQLLYVFLLTTAMVGITHGTNEILIRQWVFFFMLVFPFMYSTKLIIRRF